MIDKILVPIDGSDYSKKAIQYAAYISQNTHATIILLHVITPHGSHEGVRDFVKHESTEGNSAAFYFEQMAERISSDGYETANRFGAPKIEKNVRTGNAAEKISAFADENDCDLIIMGNQGTGGTRTIAMGSVAQKVCQSTSKSCLIVRKTLLEGKKVLIVDDEPDVLDTLEELLDMCEVTAAGTFADGATALKKDSFDLAVLDIMGVDGYKLLEMANTREITAVMLTARAMTPQDVLKSREKGAAYFIPKDKITDIDSFLTDILEAKSRGQNTWKEWARRLGSFFDKKFGPDWMPVDIRSRKLR